MKACSHITGGGFYENIPRMLKDGEHAVVEKDSYPIPPIFHKACKRGEIEEQMMYNTFNYGTWNGLAVDPADVDKTMDAIREARRSAICSRQDRGWRKGSDFMLRVLSMVSGGGTNLQAIIDSVKME